MALILLLETATEVCSVALARDGKILAGREAAEGFSHAEKLTLFISELLHDPVARIIRPDAVCISRGPGSYTGLRIGVSAAKGICYALDIPLLSVSTLDALAWHAAHPDTRPEYPLDENSLICPMLDARRMEVYTALYDHSGKAVTEISARIVTSDTFREETTKKTLIFLGNGAEKCQGTIQHPNTYFLHGINASARFMPVLAEDRYNRGEFEDIAYFEPFYLKDFLATIPKNKLF